MRQFLKNKFIRRLSGNKGQATVELAIILPIILLLMMLIIYAGIFTFSKSVVLLSTHEGGREGMLMWNSPAYTHGEKVELIRKQIMGALTTLPNGGESTVSTVDNQQGLLTVQVTYYFKLNLPFLKEITGYNAVPIHSNVIYRYTRNAIEGE